MGLKIRSASELQARRAAAERARAADAARRLLTETDWMVIRAVETGQPVPEELSRMRAEARRVANGPAIPAATGKTGKEDRNP